MPIIVEKLNYTYMDGSVLSHSALIDVSFDVREGEFLGVIGHTGSGKSTLVQHLNGLIQPASGTVTVDGFDMREKKQRIQGRKLVGMVFQYPEYQLFEETVQKDVAYGCINMGMAQGEAFARADEALSLVGLAPDKFRDKSPFELSGGEKRRAALAGIIAMRPKYLVLDEPMAGLDPIGRRDILDTIDRLRESLGCAVVMVSHSMDDMAERAERVIVLAEGRLVAAGTKDEVFGNGRLLLDNGLDIPQVSRLAIALAERGVDIREGIFDMDEMELELVRRLKA